LAFLKSGPKHRSDIATHLGISVEKASILINSVREKVKPVERGVWGLRGDFVPIVEPAARPPLEVVVAAPVEEEATKEEAGDPPPDVAPEDPPPPMPEVALEGEDTEELKKVGNLQELVLSLPPRLYFVLWERIFKKRPFSEIATTMKVSEQDAEHLYRESRRELDRLIKNDKTARAARAGLQF